MAKKKVAKESKPDATVAPVFKEEAKAKEKLFTEAEVREVVERMTRDQEEKNKKTAADITGYEKYDGDRQLQDNFPHRSSDHPTDFTYIPDYVYVGGAKRILKDSEKRYRWGRYSLPGDGLNKLPIHQLRGWRPVPYKPTYTDTGLFRESVEGWVLQGDTVLLEISQDGYARLKKEIQNRYEHMTRAVKDTFANDVQRVGGTVAPDKS